VTNLRLTAVLLISIASIAVFSGCGEDRSNLLPGNTAKEIIANLDTVDQLVSEGKCFEALDSTAEIRVQIESLDGIDSVLKRNLLDGVTELQVKIQDDCVESDSAETPAPTPTPEPAPETDPTQTTGSTGATGTTDSTGTTGTTGTTGGDTPPEPDPEPTPTPTPTPPPDPDPGGPGSGGVTPGSGGVGP
jgi:hypothetical protein